VHRQILKALDVRPTLIETSGQGRWMPTVADVERLAGEGAAGLLLASPNNPTGSMALSRRVAEIAEPCRRHRLWLISDEIYHGLEIRGGGRDGAPGSLSRGAGPADRAAQRNIGGRYLTQTGISGLPGQSSYRRHQPRRGGASGCCSLLPELSRAGAARSCEVTVSKTRSGSRCDRSATSRAGLSSACL
jgi:Aminotransferase class I and II